MELLYKFNVGDTVRFKDEQHLVQGWGWKMVQEGCPVKYYKLDNMSWMSNEILEEDLEVERECHEHTENAVMMSTDNREIHIGMKVYANVYRKFYQKDLECNLDFSFACYGEVKELWFHEEKFNSHTEVKLKREFLCTFEDGTKRHDAAGEGFESRYDSREITVEIPDSYPKQYISQLCKDDFHYDVLEPDCSSWQRYEVDQWLHHIGVYDEVMKLYAEKKSDGEVKYIHKYEAKRKYNESEKNEKLQKIVDSLSEEERKILKKML